MTNPFGELLEETTTYKWITSADQHADHPGQTLVTRDRGVVRAWARARDAEPATGVGKVHINDGGAAIRFAFPGLGRLRPISWEDWFRNFDEYDLVFVFEERTSEGLQSHKYRLVQRERLPESLDGHGPSAAPAPRPGSQGAAPAPEKPGSRRSGWRRALTLFRRAGSRR